MSHEQYNEDKSLEEVNREIEEYLLESKNNPDKVWEEEVQEDARSFSISGFLFNSMTLILIIIALVRLSNLLLSWLRQWL